MAEPFVHLMDMLANAMRWQLEDEISNLAMVSRATAGLEATATMALPVLGFGMMLYAVWDSDQQALESVRNENTKSGFSQGLIMGMLGWKWYQVDDLFVRHYVLQIYQRQELNDSRVLSYNIGLRLGYHHAAKLSPATRKGYLTVTRKISGATPGAWNRRDQIDYVIDLAGAFRTVFMPFGIQERWPWIPPFRSGGYHL
jgi:hypothetical protein